MTSQPEVLLSVEMLRCSRDSAGEASVAVMGGSVLALLADGTEFPARLARVLAGQEKPWCGRVLVGREMLPAGDRASRRLMGFVPAARPGPPGMTPVGLLKLAGSASSSRQGRNAAFELLAWVGLAEQSTAPVESLADDGAFALGLALALIDNPSVLIVERPVPEGFFGHLEALRGSGKAVVVTGGTLGDLPPCTDRVALCRGFDLVRTVSRLELLDLASRAGEIRIGFFPAIQRSLLDGLPGLESLVSTDGGWRIRSRTQLTALTWLLNIARANARTVASLEIAPAGVSEIIDMLEPVEGTNLFGESLTG